LASISCRNRSPVRLPACSQTSTFASTSRTNILVFPLRFCATGFIFGFNYVLRLSVVSSKELHLTQSFSVPTMPPKKAFDQPKKAKPLVEDKTIGVKNKKGSTVKETNSSTPSTIEIQCLA
jgi:hypothetical protein